MAMNLQEVGLRIRERRDAIGFTQEKLAAILGVRQSTVNRIENGSNTTLRRLFEIAEALKVPADELIGEKAPVLKYPAEPVIREFYQSPSVREEATQYRTQDDFVSVRILEDPAGLGTGRIISQEKTRGYALIYRNALPPKVMTQDRQHEKIICLFVKGDSMRPTIQDGSLVAIDIEDRVETVNGKIYAVALPDDGGVTIKRVYHQHGFLTLLADNRDEPGYPYCLPLKGLQYNPICGRVVWCWNRLD